MSTFEAAIRPLLEHEGGEYVPDDNGRGPSKWGVTLATAREFYPHCTADDIARMDAASAAAFYRMAFWDRYRIRRIEDQALAGKILDLAVNVGGGTAVKILQRAAGAAEDGVLGPVTAAVVNGAAAVELLAAVRREAEAHYRRIVAARPEWAGCLEGWLARLGA